MNKNYLLTLPDFNQGDSILGIIQEAKKYEVDILVIDDGSTDDTKQKIVKAKDVFKIFHTENLGYGRTSSNGSNNVGQEIDLTLNYQLHRSINLSGGYSRLFGGKVFAGSPDRDVDFAYLQVLFRY